MLEEVCVYVQGALIALGLWCVSPCIGTCVCWCVFCVPIVSAVVIFSHDDRVTVFVWVGWTTVLQTLTLRAKPRTSVFITAFCSLMICFVLTLFITCGKVFSKLISFFTLERKPQYIHE